jgi:hypothetical protein
MSLDINDIVYICDNGVTVCTGITWRSGLGRPYNYSRMETHFLSERTISMNKDSCYIYNQLEFEEIFLLYLGVMS